MAPLRLVVLADRLPPSRRDRAATAGTRDWSVPPSARTRSPAIRWPAGCRDHGGSPPDTRRTARSCRGRDRRASPRRRGSEATPRRPRRPPARRSVGRQLERGGEIAGRRRRPGREAPWSVGPWTCGSAGRSRREAYRAGRLRPSATSTPSIADASTVRGSPIRVRPCSDSASTKRRTSPSSAATAFAIAAIAAIWVMKTDRAEGAGRRAPGHAGVRRLVATRVAPGMCRAGPGECQHRRRRRHARSPRSNSPTTATPDVGVGRNVDLRDDVHVLRCRRDDPVTCRDQPGTRTEAALGSPETDTLGVREVDARHDHRREGGRQHRAAVDPAVPAHARAGLRGQHDTAHDRDRASASSPACRRSPSATTSTGARSDSSW